MVNVKVICGGICNFLVVSSEQLLSNLKSIISKECAIIYDGVIVYAYM